MKKSASKLPTIGNPWAELYLDRVISASMNENPDIYLRPESKYHRLVDYLNHVIRKLQSDV